MNFKYMDDHFGFIETESDTAWCFDDFGSLIQVPFCLPSWYWQEH